MLISSLFKFLIAIYPCDDKYVSLRDITICHGPVRIMHHASKKNDNEGGLSACFTHNSESLYAGSSCFREHFLKMFSFREKFKL